MKNEKIVHITVHQPVKFCNALCSHFSQHPAPRKQKAQMELKEDIQCVLITGGGDRILIPFVNIASIHLDSEYYQNKQEKKEKELAKPKSNSKVNKVKKPS